MGEKGELSDSPPKECCLMNRFQDRMEEQHDGSNYDPSKKRGSTDAAKATEHPSPRRSYSGSLSSITSSGSQISVVSVSTANSDGKATHEESNLAVFSSCYDEDLDNVSGDPSVEGDYLQGVLMELEEDTTQDNSYLEPFRLSQCRTETAYVRPEELPPREDEDTAKYRSEVMLSVSDVLSSESKTLQGFLDPKMTLLRALFDVPEGREYKTIANWVMVVFESCNKLMPLMQWVVRQEVQATASSHSLFREDTMASTIASVFLKSAGQLYIQKVLGPSILKMSQSKSSFEIDLNKPGGLKTNEKRLRKFVSLLLKCIFDSSSLCPAAVREFLFYMSSEIRDRFPARVVAKTVCSFFFLHYVCPIIIYPTENGAINKYPTKEAQRGLVLSAKIVQTLANGGECDTTKPHLTKLNKLIADNRAGVLDYIEGLSNKTGAATTAIQESAPALQRRKLALEELQKYMYHKLKSLPVNPTQEENGKNQPLLKLRRAVQACSKGNLTRSTSSPSGSPSFHVCRLGLEGSSPSKRRSYVDVFHYGE